jgi:hypothetical protein
MRAPSHPHRAASGSSRAPAASSSRATWTSTSISPRGSSSPRLSRLNTSLWTAATTGPLLCESLSPTIWAASPSLVASSSWSSSSYFAWSSHAGLPRVVRRCYGSGVPSASSGSWSRHAGNASSSTSAVGGMSGGRGGSSFDLNNDDAFNSVMQKAWEEFSATNEQPAEVLRALDAGEVYIRYESFFTERR